MTFVFVLILMLAAPAVQNNCFAQIETDVHPIPVRERSTNTFATVNNRLIFLTEDNKLMSTDGENTTELLEITAPYYVQDFVYNDRYYIGGGAFVYVTDGTPEGTEVLLAADNQYETFKNFLVLNGELYFHSYQTIYRYNENMQAPEPLADSHSYMREMVRVGNQLYFYNFNSGGDWVQNYYVGDGTVAGSTLISSDPHSFIIGCQFGQFSDVNNSYAFYYQTNCSPTLPTKIFINDQPASLDNDYDQWASINGVPHFAGTVNNVKGLYSFQNNQPQLRIQENVAADRVFKTIFKFNNQDIVISNNTIWNLANNNLSALKTIAADEYFSYLYQTDSKFYFTVTNGEDNPFVYAPSTIWESDGTAGGTNPIYTVDRNVRQFGILNGDLYYTLNKSFNSGFETILKKLNLDPNYNPPTVTLSTANTTVQGPFTVNVNFSESVTGFTASDVFAPGFILSNFSGAGSNYSFTATPGPDAIIDLQVGFNSAFNSSGVGNISSNLLVIDSQIDPLTLCTTELTAGPNSISVTKNYAPRTNVQLILNGQTVFSCGNSCGYDYVIEDLEPGSYYYIVQLTTLDYVNICSFDGFITVTGDGCIDNDNDGICADEDCNDNDSAFPAPVGSSCNDGNPNTINDQIQGDGCTCTGTPIGGSCNVSVSSANGSITVTGLTSLENMKVFNASYGVEGGCNPWNGNVCTATETTTGLTVGVTYFVSVQSDNCDEWIPIVVNGGGGCTDADNDGVCQNEDCDDNNPIFPGTPGTPCDDGNANTVNDVILASGCDCAGVPDSGSCNVSATSSNGNITITGLTSQENMKVFNSSYGVEFSCDPWNGNTCTGNEVATGLTAGVTYFVSVQSNDCDEWIPVVVNGGGGCTDNDNDGFCAADDCNDNDPNLPTTPGTSCNDGNSNTINDMIESDGCTCSGTPDVSSCQVVVTNTSSSITLQGLTSGENTKIFDAGYATVWSCNPWNGNPCTGNETIGNLQAGATYYVSVQSNVCEEWIPVTLGGNNNNLPDLTTSNLSIQSNVNREEVTNFTFDLNNIGNATASNDYMVNAYLSTNQVVDFGDVLVGEVFTGNTGVGTIGGVNAAIFVPSQVALGNYYLILEIDDFNAVAESNENNNLTITTIVLQDNSALPGQNLMRSNTHFSENMVQSPKIESILLFPNPVLEKLTVRLESNMEQNAIAQVFDINGRVVLEQNLSIPRFDSNFVFDVSQLQVGIYQMSIRTGNDIVQKRFVKK